MPNNLTGQNISDTYQRLLQVQGGIVSDGTGSAVTASHAVTASYAHTASIEITKEVSSSYAETASMASSNFIIQGHLTASGNISASGDVYSNQMRTSTGYRLNDSGGTSRHIIRSQNNEIEIGNSNFTDGILLTGNITASNHISSSGNITAENVRLPGGGKISFDNSLDGSDQFIIGGDEYITIDGDDYVKLRADEEVRFQDNSGTVWASIDPNKGDISASGDITSSGTINANKFQIQNRGMIDYSTASEIMRIGYNNDTETISIGRAGVTTSGLQLPTNVTASGNISSSLTSYIQTPEIKGHGTTTGLEINGYMWLSGSTSHYLSASIVSASNLNVTNISASYAIFGTPGSGHITIDPTSRITGYETDSSFKTYELGGLTQHGFLQLKANGTTTIQLQGIGANYFNTNIGFGKTQASAVGEAIHVTGNIEATGLIKTGHVTASGNISGSYLSMTSGSFNTLTIGSGSKPSNYGDVVLTSISASGNITSSGTGTNFFGGAIQLPTTKKIQWTDSQQYIYGTTTQIQIDGNDRVKLIADNDIVIDCPSFDTNGAITASGNISSSGTVTAKSASFIDLEILSGSIVGQRHILWSSPIYINTSATTTLVVDAGYFGSSAGNTRGNWNDATADAFDSSAGTFVNQVNIEEDKQNKMFTAPFPISRIEAFGSWRPANAGSAGEGYWVGIWTGSAGERLGEGSDANTQNIGFVTGSKGVYANAADWAGNNLDLDYTFSTPLPAHTQIFYGHGTSEASSVAQRNTKGHLQLIVYEAR